MLGGVYLLLVPSESRRRPNVPLELQVVISYLIWVLVTELGPLGEQGVLLTGDPFFQASVFSLF